MTLDALGSVVTTIKCQLPSVRSSLGVFRGKFDPISPSAINMQAHMQSPIKQGIYSCPDDSHTQAQIIKYSQLAEFFQIRMCLHTLAKDWLSN